MFLFQETRNVFPAVIGSNVHAKNFSIAWELTSKSMKNPAYDPKIKVGFGNSLQPIESIIGTGKLLAFLYDIFQAEIDNSLREGKSIVEIRSSSKVPGSKSIIFVFSQDFISRVSNSFSAGLVKIGIAREQIEEHKAEINAGVENYLNVFAKTLSDTYSSLAAKKTALDLHNVIPHMPAGAERFALENLKHWVEYWNNYYKNPPK